MIFEFRSSHCKKLSLYEIDFILFRVTVTVKIILYTNGHFFTDIDECVRKRHGCEHECINIPGSYRCLCKDGFTLQADRRSCLSKNILNISMVHASDVNFFNVLGKIPLKEDKKRGGENLGEWKDPDQLFMPNLK